MNIQHTTVPSLDVSVCFTSQEAENLYTASLSPATPLSAGIDLKACLETDSVTIPSGERFAVPTGLCIQPASSGWAGFIYSRSGLGARDGLTVAQGVGVIDPDYTGQIIVFLLNTGKNERRISRGERIAQLIFQPYARPRFTRVEYLPGTERGSGSFGHTGR